MAVRKQAARKKAATKKTAKRKTAKRKATKPEGKGKRPKGGRPARYTKALGDKVCRRLAECGSLRKVCSADDMPARSTVAQWIIDDVGPGFSDQYARAREVGVDSMVEETIEIADNSAGDVIVTPDGVKIDGDAIQRAKLRVDARKWYSSKIAPKKYGDKIDHNVRGDLHISVNMADAERDDDA